MTDIKIGLRITDDIERSVGQFGVAIAGDRMTDPLDVHVEAYGFIVSSEGAASVVSLLRDIADALERELGEVTAARPSFSPQARS